MIPAVEQYIKNHEGLRLDAYDDATGKPVLPGHPVIGRLTIGWGHASPDVFAGQTITVDIAERMFQHDLAAALRGAIAALGPEPWLKLDSARRCVLTDMCFELGEYGLSAFHKLLAAIRGGDWETAAAEMKASKYYEQVPKRAEQNRLMMLSGELIRGT